MSIRHVTLVINMSDDNLNKIVIMVRGNRCTRGSNLDFLTEGGLYTKYLIGEISR